MSNEPARTKHQRFFDCPSRGHRFADCLVYSNSREEIFGFCKKEYDLRFVESSSNKDKSLTTHTHTKITPTHWEARGDSINHIHERRIDMPIVYLNPIAGVYMIRCKVSGRVYVGSSRNIEDRWLRHKRELRRGKHHSWKLQKAWNKHGEDAFEFVVLEVVSNGFISIVEQAYINKYDAYKRGYNCARLTSGGGGPSGEGNGRRKIDYAIAAKIRHDYNHEGKSIASIAREVGISPEHISRVLDNEFWRDENYVRTRKPTKTKELVAQKLTMQKADEIRELHDSGQFTKKELAEKYGVYVSQIHRIISNTAWIKPGYVTTRRLKRKPTNVTEEMRVEVVELCTQLKWAEPRIAQYLDIPQSTVRRIKQDAGLVGLGR